MTERGTVAPLTPREEVTLRRVALGISTPDALPQRDLAKLTTLRLIELSDGVLRLTSLGQQRYSQLPRAISSVDEPRDAIAELARQLGKPTETP
jgi:hypothetical protein